MVLGRGGCDRGLRSAALAAPRCIDSSPRRICCRPRAAKLLPRIRLDVKVHFGLVPQSPPRAPDHDGEHFGRTQGRCAAARTARELFGPELRLQRFAILINGDIELEQCIGTTYLLLDEHRTLRGLSCSRTTLVPLRADALQLFAGNRVIKEKEKKE